MDEETYSEVTEKSWLSRIGGAFKGILVGLLVIGAAVYLLFWNEGRSVKRYTTLQQGSGVVVAASSEQVDPADEGKLVHLSGLAESDEILHDPVFRISTKALKLQRKVEMYQWKESTSSEERKKLGGGTETVTTYTYQRTWDEFLIDSSSFKKLEGHQNPAGMPFRSERFQAETVFVGAFTLSPQQVAKIGNAVPLLIDQKNPIPHGVGAKAKPSTNGLYIGDNPANPQVGDVRINFSHVLATEISLVGQQTGTSFTPYQTGDGSILLLTTGIHSAAEMFTEAQRSNTLLTWGLRSAGFILMAIGCRLILGPLVIFADVLPLLGNIVGAGTGLISGLIAGIFSFLTIGVAWILYRPILAAAFFVIACGLIILIRYALRKKQTTTDHIPPPLPPGN